MVTHDLDSLYTACDRIAVLGNGKIIAAGSIADMKASQHPWLKQYFNGKRAPRRGGASRSIVMETRANYVLIGAFTLAVIAAALGFVLWFQSLHTTKQRSPLRVVFEGPASGLRNGGSVNFNGIRIGEVISVKLDNPRRVVALTMVENKAPIRKDTVVGLEFQGLTGVAAISLKGGEEAASPVPLDEDGVPVLTADPNALQDVTEAIRSHLAKRQSPRRRQPAVGEELAA